MNEPIILRISMINEGIHNFKYFTYDENRTKALVGVS